MLNEHRFEENRIVDLSYAPVVEPLDTGSFACGYRIVGRGSKETGGFNLYLREADVCLVNDGITTTSSYKETLANFLSESGKTSQEIANLQASEPSLDPKALHFVSANSTYLPKNLRKDAGAGAACRGDSGGALISPRGQVVGVISESHGFKGQCDLATNPYKINIAAPIVSSNFFIPSIVRLCGNAQSAEECRQRITTDTWECDPNTDDWCLKQGELLPSCGQLGREFAWRRLGLEQPALWTSQADDWRLYCSNGDRLSECMGDDGTTTNCVQNNSGVAAPWEFELAASEGQQWYELTRPQNFSLDTKGTSFPLVCGPQSQQPCEGDARWSRVWDGCQACYLWFGDDHP
ncbi:MAG: trypsin-like serine protease [Myxococcales bacterium]|nr:MAG: trypsin-like serine protease [Myxococcales bacterium]